MAHGGFKDLARRTFADKVLRDKVFDVAKNPKYDWYQREIASMVKYLDKKTSGSGIKYENIFDKEWAEELHKPIIRKFKKRKVQSPFIGNISWADLANMQLISKCNKGFRFLLCVIVICSKYAWGIPFKDKKGTTITNAFQKILNEFYNKSMKSCLEKNDIEICCCWNIY